jgi:hypothetical protein
MTNVVHFNEADLDAETLQLVASFAKITASDHWAMEVIVENRKCIPNSRKGVVPLHVTNSNQLEPDA